MGVRSGFYVLCILNVGLCFLRGAGGLCFVSGKMEEGNWQFMDLMIANMPRINLNLSKHSQKRNCKSPRKVDGVRKLDV